MKILIACPKDFTNLNLYMQFCLDTIARLQYNMVIPNKDLEIVSVWDGGHSSGVFSKKFSEKHSLNLKHFKIDWYDATEPAFWKNSFYGMYNVLAGKNTTTKAVEYVRKNGGVVIIFGSGKEIDDVKKKAKIAELEIYSGSI